MMQGTPHPPIDGAQQVIRWYKKSHVDYSEHFLKLYIAYNAWYREAIGTTNDRQAIATLKKRFVIWDDYCNNKTMRQLGPYMEKLADLTQKEPLAGVDYWSGELENSYDWHSLIEYWYRVRCLIVHGERVSARYAWLAYETLDIFMGEIIDRIQSIVNSYDPTEIDKLASLAEASTTRSVTFQRLQQKLYQKYVAAPNIWQVDMQRVK